jgi:hypothetical protein
VGKKCEVCKKRRPKYPVNIHLSAKEEKVIDMCWACNRRYMKLRTKYLVKAYEELKLPFEEII